MIDDSHKLRLVSQYRSCSGYVRSPDSEVDSAAMLRIKPIKTPSLSNTCRKVIIGHPHIGRAGSESVLMWLIEALKQDFDVTVMTTGGWNLTELNSYYGTKVGEDEIKVRIAPVPFPMLGMDGAAIRGACYQRFARRIAKEYDIRISAYNFTDWGLPAIHFIADFSWHLELRNRLDPPSPGFAYRNTIARTVYLKIATALANPSGRDVLLDDLIIANSRWSAELLRQHCRAHCAAVIYPPVWTEFPQVPWEDKEQAFVMLGRIAPEKRIEQAIAILQAVRQRGFAIRLHLCGHVKDDLYGNYIVQLCRERAGWISLEGLVGGQKKVQILGHCRFGIQARAAEPFGVSVAEMIKAGAIVFAPGDGGQTEVLESPELLFSNVEDASDKICSVLASSEKQNVLRAHLAQRSNMFSAERFTKASRAAVASLESRL